MKQLIIEPKGWPCTFGECPPGLFVDGDTLCVKTEYGGDEAYVAESGEAYWGGTSTKEARAKVTVQPVVPIWTTDEDE